MLCPPLCLFGRPIVCPNFHNNNIIKVSYKIHLDTIKVCFQIQIFLPSHLNDFLMPPDDIKFSFLCSAQKALVHRAHSYVLALSLPVPISLSDSSSERSDCSHCLLHLEQPQLLLTLVKPHLSFKVQLKSSTEECSPTLVHGLFCALIAPLRTLFTLAPLADVPCTLTACEHIQSEALSLIFIFPGKVSNRCWWD